MRNDKIDEHADHRMRQRERAEASNTLAHKFPELKALTADLAYYNPESKSSNQIKYSVNLHSARSVFRFDCPNRECVRGDFDLSDALATAVAKRQKIVTGETCCAGWLSKVTIDAARCGKVLRYHLTLAYK